jgi:glycosyltransferase involved in cell wall biosynthesis
MKKITVVIPAYNAEKTLGGVLKRVPKEVVEKIHSFVVVNDGSTDKTSEILEKLEKKYGKIKILTHEKNRGYGAAQKTGFSQALKDNADIILLLHSDGQYAPEEMEKLIKPVIEDKTDIVLGSRVLGRNMLKGGMPLLKYMGNRILTKIQNFIINATLTEYHTGYRAYSRKALQKLNFKNYVDGFHFDTQILYEALEKKLRIKEVPIRTYYQGEKSYLDPWRYGIDILKLTFSYKLKKIEVNGDINTID